MGGNTRPLFLPAKGAEVEEVEGVGALKTALCRKEGILGVQRRRSVASMGRCWHILGAVGKRKMVSRRDAEGAILPHRGRWQPEGLTEGAPGAHHTRQLCARLRSPSTMLRMVN